MVHAIAAKEGPPEYLTDHQASLMIGVSRKTTYRWRLDGGGPPYIRVGQRKVFYRVADIAKWMIDRTYAHRAEEAVSQSSTP
jgi:predicted DNA-binding transcriptional regulator AlpA